MDKEEKVTSEEKLKKKKAKKAPAKTNSPLIQKSVRRCWPMFLLPITVSFFIGFIYPFYQGVYLSFCQFVRTSDVKWVGLNNYAKALKDKSYLRAYWYTGLFAIVSLVIINIVGFMIAYILTQEIKGANIYRTVFFMPNLIGGIVLGSIWSMIFDGIMRMVGAGSIVTNSKWGFWGLIAVVCWQQIGYMMIIYIAGLQAVPGDIMEAAKIDGATKWQTLIHVTIPNVMPSITICIFLSLTNGFKLFDQNLALNKGGLPIVRQGSQSVRTTELLAHNIYNTFYGSNPNARGMAQAKAVMFFVFVAVISIAQLMATKSKEVQQ